LLFIAFAGIIMAVIGLIVSFVAQKVRIKR
jgi:hypothetical protein